MFPSSCTTSFKATTAAQGKNMTDVLMDYIRQYVEKHGSQKGRRK